ncbi:MAG TPA: AmmeMemoRadiSam system protein B [bacterium]|nr:AmmeMemoRadiSam system protein B [bacterium]
MKNLIRHFGEVWMAGALGLSLATAVILAIAPPALKAAEGGNATMASSKVREPAVAGQFYPGDAKSLREMVSSMLAKAKPVDLKGRVVALISPHAGYVYSGQVAANAYRAVQGKQFDAVIVVSPSHHMYFEGSSIYREGPYKTPLGLIEIATDLADAMAKADTSVQFLPQAHAQEHAVEVQLPFLQMVLPPFKLVPVVMGDQSLESCKKLAGAIVAAAKGKNVLLVASSDLSHYHDYADAVRLDNIVIDHVKGYDPEGLVRDLDARLCEACGGGPIAAIMLAARELGATKGVVLKYANSGDVTGDSSSVVGYMAAALVAEEKAAVGVDLGLNQTEKAQLLKIARQSMEAKVLGKPIPEFKVTSALLKEKRGAFVTLTENGELRGCIGHIVGMEPLYQSVSDMAMAAATEDPRFSPVGPDELDRIAIEISALTPLRTITDPMEIEVGRDGIYIEKGYYHGLLLPQVATEYGWDRYEFLDNTCLKAGLPKGAWREGASIQIFSAQVFNEADVLNKPKSR